MYDYLDPVARADSFEVEVLLARPLARQPVCRLTHRVPQVREVRPEDLVTIEDVPPHRARQYDRTLVRIARLPHGAIVPAAGSAANWRFGT